MKTLTINNLPDLPFEIAEAVNQLRVNLTFTGTDKKVIIMTSSIPNEGKSFLALNLWKSLANVGKKVLFIDGDLRLSELRTVYKITCNEEFKGLAHFLSHQAEMKDVIYKTNVTNGYMIPVTNSVVNANILLESEYIPQILEQAKELFDYIIIDTPPLESDADALSWMPYADGSLLVVRSGLTKKVFVENSIRKLNETGVPVLGMILNRVKISGKDSSYYYKDYKNYGYSYQ